MTTWLITGASAGFGRALAEAALARGDRVAATSRREGSFDDLLADHPDDVLGLALDVTDRAQVDDAVAQAIERFDGIDVLVNNAGHGSVGAVEELQDDQLRGLFDVMFHAPVGLTQAVLPHMRERGSGAIVQVSSMGGQVSMPGFGAYCAAKSALEALSEALAAEAAPFGIRTLIVEPGAFATSFGAGNMQRSPDSGVYAETVGPVREAVDAMDGSQPGDPAKAAAAILELLDRDDAPLRLALGADAVESIGTTLDARRAELDAWAQVSRATARD